MSSASVGNDDGNGDLQALIEKQLDTNVPYLVIVCTYNPHTLYGQYVLNITK